MRTLKQVPASQIGVNPLYINSYESHGILYNTTGHHHAEPLGAQCSNCHTIVWITGRSDPILFETLPAEYKNGGEGYRIYIKDNLKRFLASLPACPCCHKQAYDLFINNVALIRFEDGSPRPALGCWKGVNETMTEAVKDKLVWWYGEGDI